MTLHSLNISIAGTLIALWTSLAVATAANTEFKFADYPASEKFSGTVKYPAFESDEDLRTFRTRIENGMKDGPNFAGHYSLIEIGCGASCRFVILIDANTGKQLDFPLGGEENYQLALAYTPESVLLKAVWLEVLDDNKSTCVNQDYQLKSGVVKLVNESRYEIKPNGICAAYE